MNDPLPIDQPFVQRLRLRHLTEYRYRQPVTFGTHRLMMRPREGHDIRILGRRTEIFPEATIRFVRDIYGNSIAILDFKKQADRLRIEVEADIGYIRDTPVEELIDPMAQYFPFQYAPEEQLELVSNVQVSGEHLLAVLNDILDYSKFESAGVELDESVCDAEQIFRSAVMVTKSNAELKGLAAAGPRRPLVTRGPSPR